MLSTEISRVQFLTRVAGQTSYGRGPRSFYLILLLKRFRTKSATYHHLSPLFEIFYTLHMYIFYHKRLIWIQYLKPIYVRLNLENILQYKFRSKPLKRGRARVKRKARVFFQHYKGVSHGRVEICMNKSRIIGGRPRGGCDRNNASRNWTQ